MHLENSKIALQNQSAVVAAMTSLADAIRTVRAPPVPTEGTGPPNPLNRGTVDIEGATGNTGEGGPTCT